MPAIFGLPEVTYWQGLGLLVLCHLLFKGHMGHGDTDGRKKWHTHVRKTDVLDMLGDEKVPPEAGGEAR